MKSRKKSTHLKKAKNPTQGSLAWFEKQWTQAALDGEVPKALGQLSYENQILRKRVKRLETALTGLIFGCTAQLILVDGFPHYMTCPKVSLGVACTCGFGEPRKIAKENLV